MFIETQGTTVNDTQSNKCCDGDMSILLHPTYLQHKYSKFGAEDQAVGEYIRAFAKHPHLVKTQYSAFLKRLPEEDLIRRSLSLGPGLRYELWSEFRKIGLEFNEVIIADSEWLGDQGRISLRAAALTAEGKDAQLLKDCKLWSKRYPTELL